MPHSRDRRAGRCHPAPIGAALYRWRSAPEPTCVRGVAPPRVRSGGSRVHSPSSPSRLAPAAGSLDRRATGTRPVHRPLFVMWPGVWAEVADAVKRSTASPVRARRSGAPAVADSAGSADPSATLAEAGRRSHARTARARMAARVAETRDHIIPGRRTVPSREATPRSGEIAKRQRTGAPMPPIRRRTSGSQTIAPSAWSRR